MNIVGAVVICGLVVLVVKFAAGFGISIPELGVYCGLENLSQAAEKAEWVIGVGTDVTFKEKS